MPDFSARRGTTTFKPPTSMWGYLPQILEKYGAVLGFDIARTGPDHMPVFTATPIWDGEVLPEYAATANTKKAAKEAAAANLALSGHC